MFRTYVMAVYLQDPEVENPKQDRIKTVFKAGALLTRSPVKNHIVKFFPDAALSKHFKRMVDEAEYDRLRLKQENVTAGYFCARCGHGIALGECSGCKRKFRYDRIQTGTGGKLPQPVRKWFENQGHKFEQ